MNALTASIFLTTGGLVGCLEVGRLVAHRLLGLSRDRRLARYDDALLAAANEGRDQ